MASVRNVTDHILDVLEGNQDIIGTDKIGKISDVILSQSDRLISAGQRALQFYDKFETEKSAHVDSGTNEMHRRASSRKRKISVIATDGGKDPNVMYKKPLLAKKRPCGKIVLHNPNMLTEGAENIIDNPEFRKRTILPTTKRLNVQNFTDSTKVCSPVDCRPDGQLISSIYVDIQKIRTAKPNEQIPQSLGQKELRQFEKETVDAAVDNDVSENSQAAAGCPPKLKRSRLSTKNVEILAKPPDSQSNNNDSKYAQTIARPTNTSSSVRELFESQDCIPPSDDVECSGNVITRNENTRRVNTSGNVTFFPLLDLLGNTMPGNSVYANSSSHCRASLSAYVKGTSYSTSLSDRLTLPTPKNSLPSHQPPRVSISLEEEVEEVSSSGIQSELVQSVTNESSVSQHKDVSLDPVSIGKLQVNEPNL